MKLNRLRSRELVAFDVSQITSQEAKTALSQIDGLTYDVEKGIVTGTRDKISNIKEQITDFKNASEELKALVSTTNKWEIIEGFNARIRSQLMEIGELRDIEIDAILEAVGRTNIKTDADAVKLLTSILGEERAVQVASKIARNVELLSANVRATVVAEEKGTSIVAKINKKASYIAEKAYHYIKAVSPDELAEMMAKETAKKLNRQIQRAFKKFMKAKRKIRDLETLFKKTGGTIIDSQVILGYKVIMNDGWENLIQLTFRPEAFKVKDPTAKNYGGKKPVYIRATASQLHKLKGSNFERYADQNINSSKFEYYLEEYAMSRGGRSEGDSVIGEVLGKSEMFLSFLPVESLRNLIRLTSLVKRNYKYFSNTKA